MPVSVSSRLLTVSMIVAATGAACSHPQPASAPAPVVSADSSSRVPEAHPSTVPSAATGNAIREFRGTYTNGWEMSWFEPCDAPMGDQLWWVTLSDAALHQRDSLLKTLKTRPSGGLAVRWRGSISERMPAGMMGRGTRYLLVTEIVALRAVPGEGACTSGVRTSLVAPRWRGATGQSLRT